jgi:hypothetical protein
VTPALPLAVPPLLAALGGLAVVIAVVNGYSKAYSP